jgi:NADH:ubiquinone oxidoreductase subunit 3 (subunit A)
MDFFSLIIINFFVCFVLVLLVFFQKTKFSSREEKEKFEGYECGFDSFYKKKIGFCVRFFNFSLLFLLIDVEIALIIPLFQKLFFIRIFINIFFVMVIYTLFILLLLLLLEFFLGGLI